MHRPPASLLLALAASLLALFGLSACGSAASPGSQQATKGMHRMANGQQMLDSQMPGMASSAGSAGDSAGGMGDMTASGAGPSVAATEICMSDIAAAVRRTFALPQVHAGQGSWDASSRTYHCDFALPNSTLKLSVRDLSQAGPGRAYFDKLRGSLPQATPIKGMQNFGFPAFQSSHGDVAFLKDHKTLWVDASGIKQTDLPPGFSREGTAFAVAAAVIACWSE